MEIVHNAEMVAKFSDIMLSEQIKKSKDRQGFHRSDAISCPMKCYNRMTGMEAIYDAQAIGYFLLGDLAHIALHRNFDAQEFHVKVANIITVSIDALMGKFPIESKSTRKKIYTKDQIPQEWLEQLAFGMASLGTDVGYLMVINIISFAVMIWEVHMSIAERDMFKQAMEWKIVILMDAIQKLDPSKLEIKRSECEYCEYKPKRIREGKACPYYNPIEKSK